MNKILKISLIVILGAALVAGLWKSFSSRPAPDSPQATQEAGLQMVRLLTGSAKFAFLGDPELKALLKEEGLVLELTKSGAFAQDVAKAADFDAVWPAGAGAAQDFAAAWKAKSSELVFSTPLALASWKPLVPVLQANGIAKPAADGHVDFYLDKALPLMLEGKRWNQFKNNEAFAVNRGFLVNTPDVRKSTTGGLYISTLAYILNGNEAPANVALGQELAEKLSPLITRQGFQESTLAGPFEDYLGPGMGKAPLVLIYESQFIEAKRDGKLKDAHVLLYPQPGLVLKHVVVARTESGEKLAQLLAKNPKAQQIAARYGFRTNQASVFEQAMKDLGLQAPEIINIADAPSTAVFEAINKTLASKIEGN